MSGTDLYSVELQRLIEDLRQLQELPGSPLTGNIQNAFQIFRYVNLLEVLDDRPITNGGPLLDILTPPPEEQRTLRCIEEFLHEFLSLCDTPSLPTYGIQEEAHDLCLGRLIRYGFLPEGSVFLSDDSSYDVDHCGFEVNCFLARWLQQWRAGDGENFNTQEPVGGDFLAFEREDEEDSEVAVSDEDSFDDSHGPWVDPEATADELFFLRSRDDCCDIHEDEYPNVDSDPRLHFDDEIDFAFQRHSETHSDSEDNTLEGRLWWDYGSEYSD
ncbi:hypothetical protein HYFRA_00013790 [Hymenoscyphus fraxineus]|uniref:Uncharacterized protein n=1 Tax=Hymenoscyphus fraxineus TaxID=746836 RepID=A0A9N9L925_9HELO|nr:hypothetical protein HYFRA_00013790 [Hymenoscyphus fraxineus]